MADLSGLRIALCQMRVIPGRPDINAEFMREEVKAAADRGMDLIVFPEMAIPGYLIGDMLEDAWFVEDVMRVNRTLVDATRAGITAIFGTVMRSVGKKGEDGRPRLHNAAVVAQQGQMLGWRMKTLQPNYRFFNDDKHLFSLRKVLEEEAVQDPRTPGTPATGHVTMREYLKPVQVPTRLGMIPMGVLLCEDLWFGDYALNPGRILVEGGAQLLLNLSASPWTKAKPRKRQEIIDAVARHCPVPLVFVNTVGAQNTGKNIIVFDGRSSVYDQSGTIVSQAPAFRAVTYDITLGTSQQAAASAQDDIADLYDALSCATKSMLDTVPPAMRKVVVGASGGIDSATALAHYVDVLGKEQVFALNMPYRFSSPALQGFAAQTAQALGVSYEVIPIHELVEVMATTAGVRPGTRPFENIQAYARRDVLAAKAQAINGVFSCNANKVEIAFGYGTLGGDLEGFYMPFGDLLKREVRAVADYLNRVRFGREVIPAGCIAAVPTAELAPAQRDPFDYGDLHRRGYHDEMVRAFTELRKNSEWFLERYLQGTLESELGLDPGTLARVFPTPKDFVEDLHARWEAFHASFFKRVQSPPLTVVSKRSFGRDLEESLLPRYMTDRHRYLARYLGEASQQKKRIAIYGASVNPPSRHHQHIVTHLARHFDHILVVPSGERGDKPSVAETAVLHREALVRLAFGAAPQVEIDFHDLQHRTFTPTVRLAERYRERFPDAELWFVVGGDLVAGGRSGQSQIQQTWQCGREIWEQLHFAVIDHPGCPVDPADLPPQAETITMEGFVGRSTLIRERLAEGLSVDDLVSAEIAGYIEEHALYRRSHVSEARQ